MGLLVGGHRVQCHRWTGCVNAGPLERLSAEADRDCGCLDISGILTVCSISVAFNLIINYNVIP